MSAIVIEPTRFGFGVFMIMMMTLKLVTVTMMMKLLITNSIVLSRLFISSLILLNISVSVFVIVNDSEFGGKKRSNLLVGCGCRGTIRMKMLR